MTNAATPFHKDGRHYPTPLQMARATDDLADLLSRDLTLPQCAEAMEVTPGTVCVLLTNLCALYGEEARA